MNTTSARTLKLLTGREYSLEELVRGLGMSYSRTAAIARELVEQGYAERKGRTLQLAKTAKAELVKRLCGRYNLETLLPDAQGKIFYRLLEPKSAQAIATETGLSQSAVYPALQKLSELGAITRNDRLYRLVDDPELTSLSGILAREEKTETAEPFATVLKTSKGRLLKRVIRGIHARGSLAGFSLFPRYGLEYSSPYDYYVDPPQEPNLESTLIQALASSETRTDRTICAIFAAKNRTKLDPDRTRGLAADWNILQDWMDISRLAEGMPPENPERFLPWKEYMEKAELYGLKVPKMQGADSSRSLLNQVGARISTPTTAYLFGGGNMLLRGLKAQTKDINLILEDADDFQRIVRTLTALGFRRIAEKEMGTQDRRLEPSGIFVAENYPRVDLFTKKVLGKFVLTDEMKDRTEEVRFEKLRLKLVSLDDVLLFKSITDRAGDIDDIAIIIRRTRPDWSLILETYWNEERITGTHFCFTILDNLEILHEREKIRVPIHRRLLQHCIDTGILESVGRGASTVEEIKKQLDFPESHLRNRIQALIKERKLKKQPRNKNLILSPP
ncbi:MAG TPA: winged helix-turn-helix domain-containing protein [Candidatus Bathyarchaeia archaeon]|nr:winged helix-turn-helix domain-containing protein [Candidatus Bathyarchaeia archaeon]